MVAVVAELEPQIAEKPALAATVVQAGHAPDPFVGGVVKPLGGASAIGELAHQDEQRNHGKSVGGKLLPDVGRREVCGCRHREQVGVAEQAGGEHGECDGHAEEHQRRHQHQADHGDDQGIHVPFPLALEQRRQQGGDRTQEIDQQGQRQAGAAQADDVDPGVHDYPQGFRK